MKKIILFAPFALITALCLPEARAFAQTKPVKVVKYDTIIRKHVDNPIVKPAKRLEACEYGFVWVKNMELKEFTVFAFGIDWKSSD